MSNQELQDLVLSAWSSVPAPPERDMEIMSRGWGDAAARAFVEIRPTQVDTESAGFHASTPLFDLPRNAAAAYLGTFLRSLLQSLAFQQETGLFDDIVTRPHTLAFITGSSFRAEVFDRLDNRRREAVSAVAGYLVKQGHLLRLTNEQGRRLIELASLSGN
jgi:hypothetical protein